MSIEQDWKTMRDTVAKGRGAEWVRCIVDLHDRLTLVQLQLRDLNTASDWYQNSIREHWSELNRINAMLDVKDATKHPDPSEWVGDLCMFDSDIPPTYHHGPFVYNGISSNGLHRDEVGHGWLHCRPATEAERIRYKGEPPTESREICMTRASDKDSWTGPRHYVGMAGNGYYVVEYKDWGNFNCVKYARKCTPEEAGDMKPLEVPEEVRG